MNEDQVEKSNTKASIITTEVQNSNEKVTNSEADSLTVKDSFGTVSTDVEVRIKNDDTVSVKDISTQRVSENIPMPVSITLDQQTIDVSAQQQDGLSTTAQQQDGLSTMTTTGESKGKDVQLDLDNAADVILYTIKAHLIEQQQSPSR